MTDPEYVALFDEAYPFDIDNPTRAFYEFVRGHAPNGTTKNLLEVRDHAERLRIILALIDGKSTTEMRPLWAHYLEPLERYEETIADPVEQLRFRWAAQVDRALMYFEAGTPSCLATYRELLDDLCFELAEYDHAGHSRLVRDLTAIAHAEIRRLPS